MTFLKRKSLRAGFVILFIVSVLLLLYISDLLPFGAKWDDGKGQEREVLPSIQEMHSMSHAELALLYHKYINTVQVLCKRIVRIGNLGEGGWEVCEDPDVKPSRPCLVYSFGINNDFSFDDMAADRYGCDVYSFDPSMNKYPEGSRGTRKWFYQTGLFETTEKFQNGWQVSTLQDLLKKHNHEQDKLDVLKIDIEKYEWLSLTQIYENGGLKNVKQLIVEFHITIMSGDPEKLEYIQGLGILKMLYDNGFKIFYSHRNMWCKFQSEIQHVDDAGCHEVSFIYIP
ncbi:probable methyltransferase-like protein 24 [Mya arenaria]|uniref:probable methyltransferase-like protein 24 n=1 Tax=Mya arenaria TaxID=6604 RepID=UPI0022E8ED13|nr:probable methyltransferase-like protein 24 [Mya arenaria]